MEEKQHARYWQFADSAQIKQMEKEMTRLRQENEILKKQWLYSRSKLIQ